MPPIIIWFQLVVVVVPQVTKAVHKLEMVEMVVRLLELQDLADSVAQLERMRQPLLEEQEVPVVFRVLQEMLQVEESVVQHQTTSELVVVVVVTV
jgi:hypothetical protein